MAPSLYVALQYAPHYVKLLEPSPAFPHKLPALVRWHGKHSKIIE